MNMKNAATLFGRYSTGYLKDALYAYMSSDLVHGKLLSAFRLLTTLLAA